MKKILVTGCYGFLAGHVIEELTLQGYISLGLARHHTGDITIPGPHTLYLGDLRDKELVEKAVAASDGVIHIGGILGTQETVNNPYPSVEVNILGALHVLEACRIWNVPMVQIAVGNYWEQNSYSITKTTAERFAIMYAKEHGVKVNVVRALNAFGERQKAKPVRKIVPSFVTRALADETIQIYGDGEQLMDMVYVKDVAKILIDVLTTKKTYGNVYEAGLGSGLSVNHIARRVLIACGKPLDRIEHLPMRPGETPHAAVIAKDPYPFSYREFEDALDETVAWYADHI